MSVTHDHRRVHIIGGAGSGKTTLADRLGTLRDVPVFDLDCVVYEDCAGPEIPEEIVAAEARRIAGMDGWVTEGVYLGGWTSVLLETADLIVWLDVPFRVAARRIVSRHVRASMAGNNRHPGLLRLAKFLRFVRSYYQGPIAPSRRRFADSLLTRRATAVTLQRYHTKVVHCRRSEDVEVLLSSFNNNRPENYAPR